MIKIAICDDEPQVLEYYTKLFRSWSADLDTNIVIDQYSGGKQLLFEWEDVQKQADILFLDILMPDISGMEVAEALRRQKCHKEIIFLTNSEVDVYRAFDVKAYHYLVKQQVTLERLKQVFLRVCREVKGKQNEYIMLSCAGENRDIRLDSIQYFEVVKHIIIVHYEDTSFEFYSTIGKIENVLLGRGFIRVHRSFIVRLGYIKKYSGNVLTLKDNTEIPVGRTYMQDLKESINKMNFNTRSR